MSKPHSKEVVDICSKTRNVEGRAIQLRSEINSLLKENPELCHNTANIKEKLKLRLELKNCK